MPKDTYEQHQERMRKLLRPPTPITSLAQRLRGLARLRRPRIIQPPSPVQPEPRQPIRKTPIMPIKPMVPRAIGGRPLKRETLAKYKESLDSYYEALKSYRKAMTVK